MEEGISKDANRTKYLNGLGITVIRFTNFQIENETQSVLSEIGRAIERLSQQKQNAIETSDSKPSPPAPLPKGEGSK
jgi:hypothetical protein